jgi:hypothetical protein
MNREKIEERIKLLESEREQLKNNLIAYEGAIQDNRHWLSHIEEEENKLKESKND